MLTIRKILVLSKLPLFHDMKPEILADLAQITLEKVYPKSENIFEKGDEGSSLYIIVEGAVRIHDASDANKASKTLAVLKEGEFFGELSILDNETRSASATAQDYSILLEIGQHSFQRLMVENFELSQNLLTSLAHRIRKLTEKIQKDS
jgi:CRP/FNR family cyclic AMP-dependent transcriptional regulator